jgi:hypothetical protein
MSNLYQDAILDAKALRASAMANAKAALEEAFQPKIEEMLRLSLSEDETEDLEDMGDMDMPMEEMGGQYHEDGMEESADINEAELEEILAQLEELSGSQDHMEETEESLNEAEEEKDETEEEDEEVEDTEEETGDETKVIDLTLGDLKQVIQSVMGGQQDMGVDAMSDDMPTDDSETESDISLDEILAEWKKEKQLTKELLKPVMNSLLTKCNIEAILLGKEIGLPPTLMMPKVTEKSEKDKK